MQTRHIGNNWVPLLGMSFLFLLGSAISMMTLRGNGASSGFFVLASLLLAVLSAAWLWKNPSWWLAPRNHYLYLAGGALVGMILVSLIPFLNGAGPWFILGGAVIVYGHFERLRLLMTIGGAVAFTGFLTMVIHADVWGGALQLLTAALLAFGSNKLHVLRHGRRREAQDSDPDFIGSFEEFDPDEALRP
ncbi:hypothetical protein MB46_18530 [Arthrobacter alpinus]|uniref:hypothetical protein n=1 Tax=Arthrobacter alpinus TaxID=656366 RepID=UPI0005CAB6BD|nr:hypothetical protein [Arthrobacter alpinus]ALV47189.1 hypothetical protein MB46_18530 [Arthrobacter alpinus]